MLTQLRTFHLFHGFIPAIESCKITASQDWFRKSQQVIETFAKMVLDQLPSSHTKIQHRIKQNPLHNLTRQHSNHVKILALTATSVCPLNSKRVNVLHLSTAQVRFLSALSLFQRYKTIT